MFALIFVYGLIISVILGAIILVLKLIGFILMAFVINLGFFSIGLVERYTGVYFLVRRDLVGINLFIIVLGL